MRQISCFLLLCGPSAEPRLSPRPNPEPMLAPCPGAEPRSALCPNAEPRLFSLSQGKKILFLMLDFLALD